MQGVGLLGAYCKIRPSLELYTTMLPVSAVATKSKALQSSVIGSEVRGSWILHDMDFSLPCASFPELTRLAPPQRGSLHLCQVRHPVKPWPSAASQTQKYILPTGQESSDQPLARQLQSCWRLPACRYIAPSRPARTGRAGRREQEELEEGHACKRIVTWCARARPGQGVGDIKIMRHSAGTKQSHAALLSNPTSVSTFSSFGICVQERLGVAPLLVS